jgi:positive regulator of sigma E activity
MFEIKHIFARAFVVLDAKEYPALRDYSRKVAENDQQQVVLVRADAATGN